MKKVLIIAYHFPPDSQVGGIRPAKFAKYLPEYGWEPHILTVKDKFYESTDNSRLNEIASVPVTRTSIFVTLMDIILYIKRLFLRSPQKESLNITASPQNGAELKQRSDSFIKRVLNSLLESPDKHVGWLIPAVWAGLKIIRKEEIDVILTTAPPATVSMVGLALSYLSGVKLVTDLRDPLTLHIAKAKSHQTLLSIKIEQWLENKLYQRSSIVTSATDRHTNFFTNCYANQYPEKFHTIWNGFDSSDFKDLASKTKTNKKFTINYIGSFYGTRNPDYFLQALHRLIVNENIKETDIQVNFIGAVAHTQNGTTKDIVAKNKLEHCVNIQGQIPYKEALNKMREADVLLLLAPADMNYYSVPAKTFEYIYANNNILCLTSDSATGDFIKKVECGKIADFFSVKEIEQRLKEFYNEWTSNKLKTNNSKIGVFERKQQTKVLADLLATLDETKT